MAPWASVTHYKCDQCDQCDKCTMDIHGWDVQTGCTLYMVENFSKEAALSPQISRQKESMALQSMIPSYYQYIYIYDIYDIYIYIYINIFQCCQATPNFLLATARCMHHRYPCTARTYHPCHGSHLHFSLEYMEVHHGRIWL